MSTEDINNKKDELCVNTIRVFCADMVQQANSGHPGAPMGLAPTAHVLYSRIMNLYPEDKDWINRDRFVLSNGHACALQYTMSYLIGFNIPMDELKKFRQLESICPGHPERGVTPGIEATTGPLGQGIANGIGMAIAGLHLAKIYNKPNFEIFNNFVYVVCGDGCLQEGVAAEAISLAGTLQLGNLILLYDNNNIQIDGNTNLSFTEDIEKRFESMGWHYQYIPDGDTDLDSIENAINIAKKITDKPSIISIKTTIGYKSKKQGTADVHGAPQGNTDLSKVKEIFGFDPNETFIISKDVQDIYEKRKEINSIYKKKWDKMFSEYQSCYPELANELLTRFKDTIPQSLIDKLMNLQLGTKPDATRNISGKILNVIAENLPQLIGGSADLTPSNKTELKCTVKHTPDTREGRYIHYGVREHGMCAIGNGLHAYGGLIPFSATFLNFIEYCFPSIRLSALSKHKHIYIMTHDSIGLGEDGPTHQPIEALSLVRATPNMLMFRPADTNEVISSYIIALQVPYPSVIALSRQNLPQLSLSKPNIVEKGAYCAFEAIGNTETDINLVLLSTGSEVSQCINAVDLLNKTQKFNIIRVISVPCTEILDQKSIEYRTSIIPSNSIVISVEAASVHGWGKYAHYSIGMGTFGASAPGDTLYKFFEFDPEGISKRVMKFVENYLDKLKGNFQKIPPAPICYREEEYNHEFGECLKKLIN